MTKIIILGAGAMSTAFSFPCNENKHQILIVGSSLDDKLIDNINENNNFHPTLKIKIPNKIKFIK